MVGLSRKQHYAQYVQVAAELGEDMPLGEDTAKAQTDKVYITMPCPLLVIFLWPCLFLLTPHGGSLPICGSSITGN